MLQQYYKDCIDLEKQDILVLKELIQASEERLKRLYTDLEKEKLASKEEQK